MIEFGKCHDISVLLGEEAIDYPGDTPFARKDVVELEKGGPYNLSRLETSLHAGTHLDMPSHFLRDGKRVENYPPETFILSALVAEIEPCRTITPEQLQDVNIRQGEALLLKTDNSRSGICRNGKFTENFVHMSTEGAVYCAQRNPALVGIDYITIESFHSKTFEAHLALVGKGIFILEGINLGDVAPGRYTLLCLPLKIKGAEGSPTRAVLLE
jgi:arylformamidase